MESAIDLSSENDFYRIFGLLCTIRNQKYYLSSNNITESDMEYFQKAGEIHFPRITASDSAEMIHFLQKNEDLLDELEEKFIDCLYKKQREPFSGLPLGIIQSIYKDLDGNNGYNDENQNFVSYPCCIGTGVLLKEDLVLTAAHVLNGLPPQQNFQIISTFWPNSCQCGEEIMIVKSRIIEDMIEVPSLYENQTAYRNRADIGMASLSKKIEFEAQPILSDIPPKDSEGLIVVILESAFCQEDGTMHYKEYEIKQQRVYSYDDLLQKGIEIPIDKKKKYFVERCIIPSASGSAFLIKFEPNKFLIKGIFNSRLVVADPIFKYRPLFSFTPVYEYKEELEKIVNQH